MIHAITMKCVGCLQMLWHAEASHVVGKQQAGSWIEARSCAWTAFSPHDYMYLVAATVTTCPRIVSKVSFKFWTVNYMYVARQSKLVVLYSMWWPLTSPFCTQMSLATRHAYDTSIVSTSNAVLSFLLLLYMTKSKLVWCEGMVTHTLTANSVGIYRLGQFPICLWTNRWPLICRKNR